MSVRSVTTRSNPWLLLLTWLLGAQTIAATKASDHCLRLQEQRDHRARQAWREEVKLMHQRRLDYGAYARCRRQAEVDLKASQPVLYINNQNVPFFTVSGAEAARKADALRKAAQNACP